MQQVWDFFSNLFGTESWPARWYCGTWSDFHGWLYILSDLAIWAAYFMIPIAIAYFITKKPNIPMPRIFWMFFAFIFLCGLTHLIDAIIFYIPIYRFSAFIRFLTAIASIGTVVAIYKLMPKALNLRTSKDFEEELALRVQVEQKLEEQTKRLQEANDELEQFAYVASHDLKEPLRTIKNSIGLLEDELADKDDESINKIFGFTQNAATHMQELINNLLEYSQFGHRNQNEKVDLDGVVDFVKQELATLIEETDAQITSDNLPVVTGNGQELHRLLQNLINNSIKFRIKNTALKIHIGVSSENNHYLFCVKDNGIGIPEDQQDRIFKLFQRLHSSKEYTGTGIGLAICKKIVELHNGQIWLESKPGNGTTFYFTLPKPTQSHE